MKLIFLKNRVGEGVVLLSFAATLFFSPVSYVSGQVVLGDSFRQLITAHILPDFSATGRWAMVINTNDTYSAYQFSRPQNFGMTGSINYEVTGVENDSNNSLPFKVSGENSFMVNPGYLSGKGLRRVYVDYKIETPFKAPLALYEFFLEEGAFFRSPQLTIDYPKDWKLISAWPEATSTNPFVVDYPTGTEYTWPAIAVFEPPMTPDSQWKKSEDGHFTIYGDASSVAKLTEAAHSLPFLDDLYMSIFGFPAPKRVIVLSTDMSRTNIGYEVYALAVRPNIILVNQSFVGSEHVDELASLLVHETTHLVEINQNLFQGSPYIAPWFHEGLAVFAENRARHLIFKTPEVLAQHDLVGSSRVFTVTQLKNKYQESFDYLFDGSNYFNIGESYKHAGLVIGNFFNTVGLPGMKKLFADLKSLNSNQFCDDCDSTHIITDMSAISSQSSDDTLFPYKDNLETSKEIASLLSPKYDDALATSVFLNFLKNEVTHYFGPKAQRLSVPAEMLVSATSSTTTAPAVNSKLKPVKIQPVKPLKVVPAKSIKKSIKTTVATTTSAVNLKSNSVKK